jgi:anti-anti-sigma factor
MRRWSAVPPAERDEASEDAGIVVDYREGVTVIGLTGEHDVRSAGALRGVIAEQVRRNSGAVVSLEDARFIDSAIIHELFIGDRQMLENGRRLVLHGIRGATVERVLKLSNIHQHFACCDSLDDATALASRQTAGESS